MKWRRRKFLRRLLLLFIFIIILGLSSILYYHEFYYQKNEIKDIVEETKTNKVANQVIITAVGDCTIGTDPKFPYEDSLVQVYDKNNQDDSYFFKNVYDIISNDDLTIANMEGTFTTRTDKVIKAYNFKADPKMVKVFTSSSVEAVNIANNHTYDFGEGGFEDTVNTLKDAKLVYFGYDTYQILEVNGIKIGLAGLTNCNDYDCDIINEDLYKKVDNAISYFEEQTDLVIISFHWGVEATLKQTDEEVALAHYAIDKGADLILGHHPHRIQGIETYNGKNIVYSLSNFVFGGVRYPSYIDTFLYQQTFTLEDGKITPGKVTLYPATFSGLKGKNNFQPKLATGDEKTKILKEIMQYSVNFNYEGE